MGISEPKGRVTVTLDPAVKRKLESRVPKSERSRFVELAIAKALDKVAKDEAMAAIREFKRYPLKGPGVVETLREVRHERDEQLASRHKSRSAAE